MAAKIYVSVDDIDVSKAPKDYAPLVKKSVTDGVNAALKASPDTTIDTKGEGFTLTMKVAKLTVDPGAADLKLTASMTRYPNKREMFTLGGGKDYSSEANATAGAPEALIGQCVDAVVGTMMPKIIAAMKKGRR